MWVFATSVTQEDLLFPHMRVAEPLLLAGGYPPHCPANMSDQLLDVSVHERV